ncbi:hypothetical protein [Intrasporangium sp. YIM S08009]|uniref:hypothetical protein n=1 Tax=Intrasporangium zincisolvens TaxID=3080018 RepID=UPI002B055330|nr:hypothetical protein [Intrasporangium sp. YIM S08009]
MPPPLTDLGLVDDVHVTVEFGGAAGPEEVFVLDLHLANPAEAAADATYLSALSPVVALVGPGHECTLRIGREHRLGKHRTSTVTVSLSLPMPPPRADETDPAERSHEHQTLQAAVALAFRSVMGHTADAPTHALAHDEAMASARRRLADIYPDVLGRPLSVSAEQHLGSEWAVRLVGPSGPGFEVRIGFVDGHPGTTMARRIRTGEVVDSVGSG